MKIKPFLSRDAVKYIAITEMFICHLITRIFIDIPTAELSPIIRFFGHDLSIIVGPIMFFFIADGFMYTHSRKKYALRLLLFAAVSQIPYTILEHHTLFTLSLFTSLNVMFTLFFGLIGLIIWDSKLKLPARITLIVLLDGITILLQAEWLLTAVPVILGLHIFREKPKIRFFWFTLWLMLVPLIQFFTGAESILTSILNGIFIILVYLMMTKLYSGKKGHHPVFAKWFFYIFYPVHLLIILLIQQTLC